jgi:hypothetical protein
MLVQNCTEEESNRSTGNIQFVFDPGKIADPNGKTSAADFPAGSYLIVSIEDNSGHAIHTRKSINLIQVGDNFISDPLPLTSDSYKLTEFMVVRSDRALLYAAPKAQSPLAKYVDRPLPISFTVTENALLEEAVQVVDVKGSNPEDFGYISFGLDIVRKFGLSVFIPDDNSLSLTTAEAFLIMDDDTVHVQDLDAKVNTILFEEDPDDSVELVVIKDGYSKYVKMFTFNQLKDELDGNPLTVVFTQALTFTVDLPDWGGTEFNFAFNITVLHVPVIIHWGDGTSDVLSTNESHYSHAYDGPGKYFVDVTGDLNVIEGLGFYYDDGRFTKIDLQHLKNLQSFGAGYMGTSPSVIDFSQNKKLEVALLGYLPELERVIFPAGVKLYGVDIGGPNKLTAQDVNEVIDLVYQSAVLNGIYDGYFSVSNPVTNELTGPPSPESIAKLVTLRDTYAWQINPQAIGE